MTRRGASQAERREARAAIDDPGVVFEAALRFLEPRSRSVAEVRTHLAHAGYRRDLVETAVDRLLDLGMLDDEAFARHWVESRDRAHPRGTIALRNELRRKGIAADTVRDVLTDREADGADGTAGDGGPVLSADERAAERLLARRAAALARVVDPRERRRRAYAMLARAGFVPDVCLSVAAAASRAEQELDSEGGADEA